MSERFRAVETGRVVLFDAPALAMDLDVDLARLTPKVRAGFVAAMRAWLLQEAAIVSQEQLSHDTVNAAIPVGDRKLEGFRPPRYGRACFRLVDDPVPGWARSNLPHLAGASVVEPRPDKVWLDIKGVGVGPGCTPQRRAYSNGLMSLSEAFEEYLWSRLVGAVFHHCEAPCASLPIYAIIDLGFAILDETGARLPAAVCVRRGHLRSWVSDLPIARSEEQRACLSVELMLRRFGLTSSADDPIRLDRKPDGVWLSDCPGLKAPARVPEALLAGFEGRRFPIEVEGVNIQIARSGRSSGLEVVDFGHFKTRKRFERPLVSTVANWPGAFGGVLWPEDAGFPQPDPGLVPVGDCWGWRQHPERGEVRGTALVADRLAQKAQSAAAAGETLKAEVDALIDRAASGWKEEGGR
ncbi:hypothetical protein [Stappia indica]|uniref:hypothetical protein n=1 Tax=Stappia indica TaxID=538381 RepID=UPI001CD783C5|nr:hypothetical protein [Stappia indica]MCA1298555.1 hypothetical protein [Stappia indica]